MRKLIAGNWKMNGVSASLVEAERLMALFEFAGPEIVICPPATLVAAMAARFRGSPLLVGGQDCHAQPSGAHTGDISAEMLKDAGASYVIVGHSERRQDHGESDAAVRAKAEAGRRAGLAPIVCVGETESERRAGRETEVVGRQLEGSLPRGPGPIVIAYEPVWAIGTGLTPTPEDIAAMHAFIRGRAGGGVRLLYGGSVKPTNARDILHLPEVNGALVGGASLKAEEFHAIVRAAM
ncbi:MAG: triose-phosphate isomerase [Parvularculaceae bacterium]|nr:triose-phosphate isomerase [Parvularculaceae bacterium]